MWDGEGGAPCPGTHAKIVRGRSLTVLKRIVALRLAGPKAEMSFTLPVAVSLIAVLHS